jgi:hypothetical protein
LSVAVCEKVPSGRLLLGQAGRHDLAEQPQDLLVAQRTLVPLARHAQHLRLAFRAVEIHGVAVGVLGHAHLARETRAFVQQPVDARVDVIDFRAQASQRVATRWLCRPGLGLRFCHRA